MAKTDSVLAWAPAPCRFELWDGGGVCIEPGSSLPSLILPAKMVSSVFRDIAPTESRSTDEESCRDDSTGGKARSGFRERWCT
jgi:hypothetical protein